MNPDDMLIDMGILRTAKMSEKKSLIIVGLNITLTCFGTIAAAFMDKRGFNCKLLFFGIV